MVAASSVSEGCCRNNGVREDHGESAWLLQLDARLRTDARIERMFYRAHFGDGVGVFDQRVGRGAPGQHHVLHRRAVAQRFQYLPDLQVVELQRDVDFIQHHQRDVRVAQHAASHIPCGLRRCNVALLVLGFPGEAFAHHVILDFREAAKKRFLAGGKTAFDELHHADAHVVPEGTGDHAEGRGALAFAVAGVHQHHAAVLGGAVDLCVHHFLVALRAGAVPLVGSGHILIAHYLTVFLAITGARAVSTAYNAAAHARYSMPPAKYWG